MRSPRLTAARNKPCPRGVHVPAHAEGQPGAAVTILVLAIIRLAIRLTRGAPPAHRDKHAILIWIGYATHFALYGFIFLMPFTGALAWFFGIELSAEIHEIGRLILIPTIGLHILGGLAEHFVFKNDSLLRMLRPAG